MPFLEGVAEAALNCAHRTSTVSPCAFCEQGGHLAAPYPSFSRRALREHGDRPSYPTSFFSILLLGFGALDRSWLGQYQGSGRIGWANLRNNERALLLVHVDLGSPAHFLAEKGYRFAE